MTHEDCPVRTSTFVRFPFYIHARAADGIGGTVTIRAWYGTSEPFTNEVILVGDGIRCVGPIAGDASHVYAEMVKFRDDILGTFNDEQSYEENNGGS